MKNSTRMILFLWNYWSLAYLDEFTNDKNISGRWNAPRSENGSGYQRILSSLCLKRLETSWKYLWICMYTFHGGLHFFNIIVAMAVLHNIVIADGDENRDENMPPFSDELDPHTFKKLLERDEITNINIDVSSLPASTTRTLIINGYFQNL
ncbi:unnamed protein product [Acanthoscelides obtectus]|uniref:DDE Tnp4 domain-containing protein n=1 Tax=Acanthoscelides obtectus TaxID=200917 RepID=A0A9P0JNC0_ACAOB|nr:unnamed protein product [Acanthoscelides obtectus]CAK1639980.1 hypothetical protein AOBTE_LOCUS11481 [Acanthoscelides obtectus]